MDLQKEYKKYTKWTNRRIRLNRFYRCVPKRKCESASQSQYMRSKVCGGGDEVLYADSPHRFYSDKVSFIKELLKTACRLIVLWFLTAMIATVNPSVNMFMYRIMVYGTLALIGYFIYYIIKCAREKNLRL